MDFLQGIFSRVKSWFAGIWEKTEKRDRTRFLVISAVALVLLISAVVVLNNNRYTVLLSTDNAVSMRTATGALDDSGIPFRVTGSALEVNKRDYAEAQAAMLMRSDVNLDMDLSIYALGTGLTSTSADRDQYTRYQLESELKRTFEALPMVDHARVFISVPETGFLFTGEEKPATASIALWLNADIGEAQARNFVEFVAGAANVLPENITITDQYMRDVSPRPADGFPSAQYASHYEHRLRVQNDINRSASRMLNPLFGPMNVVVESEVRMDFDERTVEEVIFTPVVDDEGIPRSMVTISEFAQGANLPGGFPGTDENGLGMDAAEYAEILEPFQSIWERNQTTVNYEINQRNEYVRESQGTITGVTVSVTVNTDPEDIEDTAANTAAVQELVGAIVGLTSGQDIARVVVRYMPFLGVREQQRQEQEWQERQDREDLYALIQTLVLYGIIGLCLILLIWRTFALLKPQVVEIPSEGLAGDADEYAGLLEAATATTELEVIKTPSRERIEEFVDANPEAVAHMLRAWLQEEEDFKW